MQVVWTKNVSPILAAMLIVSFAASPASGSRGSASPVGDDAAKHILAEDTLVNTFLAANRGGNAGDDVPPPVSNALSKLTVHGFLTQAYADASFATGGISTPSVDEFALGIPEDGTFDYRTMAIQFRYEISPKDVFIVQLSSRSLGESPIGDIEDDIELDWAFYERRLADNTVVKIGRIQIPFGIFNELRDVGTLLPFYRPSYAFYNEGSFTSETVDGLLLAHTFAPQAKWTFDLDVYLGTWELFEFDPFTMEVKVAQIEDALGFQLWVNTPVDGLRFGLGGNRRDVSGGNVGVLRAPGEEDEFIDLHASLDLARERYVVRAEYRQIDADPGLIFFGATFDAWYVQLGYHPTEKLRLYAQIEGVDVSNERTDSVKPFGIPFTQDLDAAFRRDTGVAINYIFSANMVLKLEHHFNVENEFFALVPTFTPSGPALQPIYQTARDGEYSILSFSVSF